MSNRAFTALLNHPDIVSGKVASSLRDNGFSVVDNALGHSLGSLIKNEIHHLKCLNKLHLNSTHFVDSENKVTLLEKENIWEMSSEEIRDGNGFDVSTETLNNLVIESQETLCPLFADVLNIPISYSSLKMQYNTGSGGCFPYHFDTAPGVDTRMLTAVYYLNDNWNPNSGGEIALNPFPYPEISVAPLFDRLVLFSSLEMLHRVLPSNDPRYCLTFWLYGYDKGNTSKTSYVQPFSIMGKDNKSIADIDEEKAVNILITGANRRHFSRMAYADDWRRSILQSHTMSSSNTIKDSVQSALDRHDKEVGIILKSFQAFLRSKNFSGDAADPLKLVEKHIPVLNQPGLVNWFPYSSFVTGNRNM